MLSLIKEVSGMGKIIKALYYGNLAPSENLPETKERKRKNEILFKALEDLENQVPKPLWDKLESVLDKQAEAFELEAAQAFAEGFKLGARLFAEAFEKNAGLN